jgi:hypothetical protein
MERAVAFVESMTLAGRELPINDGRYPTARAETDND